MREWEGERRDKRKGGGREERGEEREVKWDGRLEGWEGTAERKRMEG